MTWTEFWEFRDKGKIYYYIEADYSEASKVMKDKFSKHVGGGEYHWSNETYPTFTLVSGFNRNLKSLDVPKINGKYDNFNPVVQANIWMEDDQSIPEGYTATIKKGSQSIEEFEKRDDVVIVRKNEL